MNEFSELDDVNSNIYKRNLAIQKKYISEKMFNNKSNILNNKTKLTGTIEDIVKHCSPMAATLVKNFFHSCKLNGYDNRECSHCKRINCVILEKAHCSCGSRPELLERAIKKLHINNTSPIVSGQIFREFILLHTNTPLFLLCQPCHRSYDKVPNNKTVEKSQHKTVISHVRNIVKTNEVIPFHMSTRSRRNIKNSLRSYSKIPECLI